MLSEMSQTEKYCMISHMELKKLSQQTSQKETDSQIQRTRDRQDRGKRLKYKLTADGDCSQEIKRCLLLGRKAMTNVDSILKSLDITLPTKVRLVKAIAFPVVMYGCKNWTVKKAEC